MQTYDSNTFNTNQGRQDAPGGAVFYNNSLIYVSSRGGNLEIVTCVPPPGKDNWTVVAPPQEKWGSSWSNSSTSTSSGKGVLSTPLVILPGPGGGGAALYAVGSNSTVYLMNADQKSFTPIRIQSSAGDVQTCGATAWGNYLVVGWNLGGANALMWDAYDVTKLPNPIDSEFVWEPAQESGGIPQSFGLPSDGLGPVVSMDWFTMGGDNFYMVTSYMNKDNPVLLVTPMENGVPVASMTPPFDYDPTGMCQVVQNTGGQDGITVLRDPAGRIRLYTVSSAPPAANGTPSACATTIPTVTDPMLPDSPWTQDFSTLWNVIGQGMKANQAPVGCFALGASYAITDPVGSANDVYEIALFSPDHNNSIWCDISAFGTAQALPDYYEGNLLPDKAPNYAGAVSGIIDSPFPIPATNISDNPKYSGGADFGSVVFGVASSSTADRSASFSWNVGVSSVGVTSAGIGPAWDITYSAGTSTSSGSSTTSETIQPCAVGASTDSTGAVVPNGAFFAGDVIFHYNWYRIVDLNGNWVADCPAFCSIVPILGGTIQNSFASYLVTPGELQSYTRESITAKALALGLIQTGQDYITDIIEPQALAIGAGGENFMTYSVGDNSSVLPASVQNSENWTESGWSIDASNYVGYGAGASISLGFSFIVEGSVEAAGFNEENMIGTALSVDHSTTDDSSTQVTIELQDFVWPKWQVGTDIENCNFRLYFLPANQAWIQELMKCAGLPNLDAASAPWRIIFVVDSYSSHDGTIHYP